MSDKRGRLLVLEDHQALRAAMAGFLGTLGYEVSIADDTDEALVRARETRPDLVFCDLNAKGSPCLNLLRVLKSDLPQTKVIITGTATTCEKGYILGACYCLSHPIMASELMTALKHCLDHDVEMKSPAKVSTSPAAGAA